jgi:hypothetical protein
MGIGIADIAYSGGHGLTIYHIYYHGFRAMEDLSDLKF